MDSTPGTTEAEDVADLLEAVAQANDRIAASRADVGDTAVDGPGRLANLARPGAAARAQLSELDPALLLAGTSVWLKRLRRRQTGAGVRAQRPWGGSTA